MPKFQVIFQVPRYVAINVDTKHKTEAKVKARKMYEKNPRKYETARCEVSDSVMEVVLLDDTERDVA